LYSVCSQATLRDGLADPRLRKMQENAKEPGGAVSCIQAVFDKISHSILRK